MKRWPMLWIRPDVAQPASDRTQPANFRIGLRHDLREAGDCRLQRPPSPGRPEGLDGRGGLQDCQDNCDYRHGSDIAPERARSSRPNGPAPSPARSPPPGPHRAHDRRRAGSPSGRNGRAAASPARPAPAARRSSADDRAMLVAHEDVAAPRRRPATTTGGPASVESAFSPASTVTIPAALALITVASTNKAGSNTGASPAASSQSPYSRSRKM